MHKMVQQVLLQFRLMKVFRKMLQISMCKRRKLCKRCKPCPKPQALKHSPSEEADLRAPRTGLHENLA